MSRGTPMSEARARRRLRVNRLFVMLCITSCTVSVIVLSVLLGAILVKGFSRIDGVNREALAGTHVPVEFPDGVVRNVEVAAFAPSDRVLRVAHDGESFSVALSSLTLTDGVYRGEHEWKGEVEFPESAVVGSEEVLAYDDPEHGRVTLTPSQLNERSLLGRVGQYTELGQFLSSPPSSDAGRAGFMPALGGSLYLCLVCALTALPIGVGTAVFLEEYRPRGRWLRVLHSFVEINIRNLAGVPSIVYGILGLTAFVSLFGVGNPREPFFEFGHERAWYYVKLPFGRGALAGGLTLMLVVLPVVIISTQESLRAVPKSLREGTLAMGATRWQMVWKMTLPNAVPGIMTGSILSISRAIGEAAPILVIAGIVYITYWPDNLMSGFTVMPLQIYNWASRPQEDMHVTAAAGIMVLLAVLLTLNAAAILIRNKFEKKLQ